MALPRRPLRLLRDLSARPSRGRREPRCLLDPPLDPGPATGPCRAGLASGSARRCSSELAVGLVLVAASGREIGPVEFGADRAAVRLARSLTPELGNLPVPPTRRAASQRVVSAARRCGPRRGEVGVPQGRAGRLRGERGRRWAAPAAGGGGPGSPPP